MTTIYYPDSKKQLSFKENNTLKIFLAGSIEMDKAKPWQEMLCKAIENKYPTTDISIFNPRRKNWDNTIEQKKSNPKFNYQVNWEAEHLERADVVLFFFQGDTISPISLFELGLTINSGKQWVIVYCEDEYFRKGNIDIYIERYNAIAVSSFEGLVSKLEPFITS